MIFSLFGRFSWAYNAIISNKRARVEYTSINCLKNRNISAISRLWTMLYKGMFSLFVAPRELRMPPPFHFLTQAYDCHPLPLVSGTWRFHLSAIWANWSPKIKSIFSFLLQPGYCEFKQKTTPFYYYYYYSYFHALLISYFDVAKTDRGRGGVRYFRIQLDRFCSLDYKKKGKHKTSLLWGPREAVTFPPLTHQFKKKS